MNKKKLKNALIGHTGFIGSNLKDLKKNFSYFNSYNIHKIERKKYESIYCAGTYSKIWIANKKPLEDRKNIDKLIKHLRRVDAKKIFLISSSEVYGNQKKTFENSKIDNVKKKPYAYNRLKLEKFVEKKFSKHFILRLPIVYGKNFVKNFIFDLISKKNIKNLNGNDYVQIYNVSNLQNHLKFIEKENIRKINISSKPFKVKYLAKKFFGVLLKNKKKFRVINIKSIYGSHNKTYFLSQKKTIEDLKKFLKKK